MRVLEVTNTYPPGDISGVGALVEELALALHASGHVPTVLTREKAPADPHAVAVGGPKVLFPVLAAGRWAALARRDIFDVVHVHESDGVLVALLLRCARALGRPSGRARLVATLQVSYRRERQAVRRIRDRGGQELSRPRLGELVFAWVRAPLLSLAGRLTALLADAVVAPSQGTARELEADYGARRVSVIPNGVEAPPRTLVVSRQAEDPPAVLYAGRLRTRKAVAVLVEALSQLRRVCPDALLIVAGSGEQRPALEAQVSRLGLGGSVRFEGLVARSRMPELYARARVFCLPSIYEGFPVAILEAMAEGLAVVSTRVAGIPEAVEDGVTGLVVAPEDVSALAGALGRLLLDPALARRMGEAGRARLEREFSRKGVTRAYVELFERTGDAC